MELKSLIKHHFAVKKQLFRPYILEMSQKVLLDFLVMNHGDNAWDLFNFIIVAQNFRTAFSGPYTNVGAPFYADLESDLERAYVDLRIFQLIVENEINEELGLIYELKGENFVFKLNLDRILTQDVTYDLKINVEKFLPRTKNEKLKRKIINVNLVYGVLKRFKDLIFFNKKTSKVEELIEPGVAPEYSHWAKKILFTKGYVLIFPNTVVKILVNLAYRRKIVSLNPIKTEFRGKIKTVRESLKNNNYSNPIWMKSLNINDFNTLDKNNIVGNILDEEFEPTMLTKNLNFLNSISLQPDLSFFKLVENISLKSNMLDKEYITKERLEESLISLDEGIVYIERDKIVEIEQERLNCLSFVNLVKIQYSRFSKFFLEYRRDGRIRIYNYNYPINFQLSHLVRNSLKIEKTRLDTKEIIRRFMKLPIWGEFEQGAWEIPLFFWQKLEKSLVIKIANKFKVTFVYEGEMREKMEKNLEIEGLLILIESFAPKNIISLNKRVQWVAEKSLDKLINLDLSNVGEIENLLLAMEIKKKKLHFIRNIYNLQRAYKYKIYDEIFWVDASSNGIQLITLRLGKFNSFLLQLTNIIDNKTECRNIYAYITKELEKIDHSNFINESLKNKITSKELNLLYNDDDNKDRVMPGSYGKGKAAARKDMEGYITEENREIWNKLEEKERNTLSDYIWTNVFEILKRIGFDLALYKVACKNFLGEEDKIVCWYNDCGLPIVPFKEKKSTRGKLLKQLEILKQKERENRKRWVDGKKAVLAELEDIEKVASNLRLEISKINEKLVWDDKKFYKRTKVRRNDSFISPRIKHSEPEIDRVKVLRGLAPNATHAYDGSNMDKTIEKMAKLGLNALPIFDSLGGELKYMSLIKILFKLSNIENIENNYKEPKFPHIAISMEKESRYKLYAQILESSYFIR